MDLLIASIVHSIAIPVSLSERGAIAMPYLTDLSLDILLSISTYLSIANGIAFIQTCSTIRALAHQRSFWIYLLSGNRFETPLACPLYEDFSKCDLNRLKFLAFKTLAPYLPSTLATREIHSFEISELGDILFLVPGTDLVVLASQDGVADCWDTSLGRKMCSVRLPIAAGFVRCTSEFQEPGRCSVGVASTHDVYAHFCIVILSVTYSSRLAMNFSFHAFPTLSNLSILSQHIALNGEIIAMAFDCFKDNVVKILAFNHTTGNSHTVKTDIPSDILLFDEEIRFTPQLDMEFFQEDLGIFVTTASAHNHYLCPQMFLPYVKNAEPCSLLRCFDAGTTIPHPQEEEDPFSPFSTYISRFTGITVQMLDEGSDEPTGMDRVMAVCDPDSGVHEFSISLPEGWSWGATTDNPPTSWATKFIYYAMDENHCKKSMHLFSYDPRAHDFSISVHRVRLPKDVIKECHSFGIDEGRRELLIITERKIVFRLSL